MYFSADVTSINENPADLQLSQASSGLPFLLTFIDMIPESIAISDDYLFHEPAASTASPCMPTLAHDIEIFRRILAGN